MAVLKRRSSPDPTTPPREDPRIAQYRAQAQQGAMTWSQRNEQYQQQQQERLERVQAVIPNATPQNARYVPDFALQRLEASKQEEVAAKQQEQSNWSSALGNSRVQVRELTWDEYSALSPRQQAAIDANTALVQASTADKELDPSARDKSYDARAEELFGAGGAGVYAPNTLKLLEDMGISDMQGRNLNDFLTLNAGINSTDLENLDKYAENESRILSSPGNTYLARQQNALTLSSAAARTLRERLQTGQTGLNGQQMQFGYDGTEASQRLNMFYDTLASRSKGMTEEELFNTFASFDEAFGIKPTHVRDYFESRLRADELAVLNGEGVNHVDYMTADEFRNTYYKKG